MRVLWEGVGRRGESRVWECGSVCVRVCVFDPHKKSEQWKNEKVLGSIYTQMAEVYTVEKLGKVNKQKR